MRIAYVFLLVAFIYSPVAEAAGDGKYNVLFIILDDPEKQVRDAAFCVSPMQRGFLLREDRWANMQYGEDGKSGAELFDMDEDPKQYVNLAGDPEHAERVEVFEKKMAAKLKALRTNDL